MAGWRWNRPLGASLFALIISLVVLGGVFIGGRLPSTAQAATGDLGAWTASTPLTSPTWAFASAAGSGYVYISGGETTGSVNLTGTMRSGINTDGSLGTWESQTDLSDARIDHGMVYTETAANRCLFVVGGYTSQSETVTSSVEYATVGTDGAIGTWAQTSAMISPRAHFGLAANAGRIYALGGSSTGGSSTASVEFASINSDCSLSSWQNTVPMTSTHSGNRAFAANSVLYSTGDMSSTLSSGVQHAPIGSDGMVGPWASTSPMGQKRADHAVVASSRAGYVYALGGLEPGSFVQLNSVERAALNPDGSLGGWGFVTNLPFASEDMAFAQANGRIYMLGGSSGSITSTVYYNAIEGAGNPNLSGSSMAVSGSATPGQTISYTVVLSNTGNGPASARVTDTLPVSVTYQSGTAASGATYDAASRSIRWTGVVTAGASVSISYRSTITSPMDNGLVITNTATVDDGSGSVFETTPVTTTITSAPDLNTSRKTVNKPISSPGGTVGYSIVVSNTGGMHTAARVTDTLPINLTYVPNTLQSTMGTSVYDSGTGSIYWAGPALVGVPVTISYQARVNSSLASGSLVANAATIQSVAGTLRETSPVTVTVVSNPSRVGWTNLGLYGAIVSNVAFDPINDVVYQSGTANPGVWRTANGGESWLPTSLPSNCGPVVVEKSSGVTYANCQQNLWKTSDAGISWTNVLTRSMSPSGFQGIGWGGPIVVTATTLYVGDSQGAVLKSDDAGATWNQRGTISSGTNIRRLAVDPTDSSVVYAVTETKVYESIDGGGNWTEITPPAGDTDFRTIAVSPFDNNMVFAGTVNTTHLWKSTNGGTSWTRLDQRAGWLVFHPTDPNTIYAEGVSHDGGASWTSLPIPGGGMDIDPRNPNVIYANSGHGMQKSIDGGVTWTEINTGLEEVPIDDVSQNPQDPNNFFVVSRTGLGRSFNGGTDWTWPLGTGNVIEDAGYAVTMDPSNVYIGANGLARSTDNGRSWVASNLRPVQEADLGAGRSAQIHDIGIVPGDPLHIFAAVAEPPPPGVTPKGGVYESTDGGMTWASTGLRDLPVNSIGFGAAASGTIIYAGVGDQWSTAGIAGGIYTSTVGNTSVWSRTTMTDTYVWKLRVDPANPLVVYAGGLKPESTQGPAVTALYKSTNGGASWADLLPAAPRENALRALAIDPVYPNNVFYSASSKVYQSVDGGSTWTIFGDIDLGGEGINALLVPVVAPSPVVSFTASISGSQAVLNWTNSTDSDFAGVTVKYSTQGFPMLSTEGITLTTATGLPGATGIYTHTGVVTGTTYYYSVFANNQAGRYSIPKQAAAQPGTSISFPSVAQLLSVRSASGSVRRPAVGAGPSRNIYAAAGGGLFSKEIGGQTTIYLPYVTRQFVPGW